MTIGENIRRLEDRIADVCAAAGRSPSAVALVAVSKGKTAAQMREAIEAGIQHLGENRVEEAMDKIPQVIAQASRAPVWHMVGHVQSRKAKLVAERFDMVQSVDSVKLAKRLSRFAGERNRKLRALLEINVSGEASKYGLAGYNWYRDNSIKDRLWQDIDEIAALPHIQVEGLMTMAPYAAAEATIRRVFADLRGLRDELSPALSTPLVELSMGMTDDYPIAIEEGATMIRLGRAIFGERD